MTKAKLTEPYAVYNGHAVFDALGVSYSRTAINKSPSITKEWLEHHEHR